MEYDKLYHISYLSRYIHPDMNVNICILLSQVSFCLMTKLQSKSNIEGEAHALYFVPCLTLNTQNPSSVYIITGTTPEADSKRTLIVHLLYTYCTV